MFKLKPIKEVVTLINDLQNIPDPEHFRGETLSALEKLFNGSDSVILDWTPFVQGARGLSKDDMFFHKFVKQPSWDYPKVHQQDPIYDWIETGRCHDDFYATRLSDLSNFRDLKKTEFYREILVPLNCRYVLTMAAHQGDNIQASISITRPSGGSDFTASDVQLAQLITPVLANAYSLMLLKKKSALNDDIFKIVASQLQSKPYIIFSSDLDSVYRSDQMTLLGRHLRGVGGSISDIFARSPSISKYVKKFTANNLAQHKRLPEKISDSVSIGRNKMVHIELQLFTLSPGKRYLMTTLKLANSNEPASHLHSDYGLTMRENQIAQMAAKGLSSREVGKALAISPWSVKNHLKNIYRKTGINSRAALAQIVSRQG
ncbi:MAG: DNA-binding CsgD family transcriptional regulator [Alcanivorax sp.]|jgi:DNA-binding CsgD family transcriptional regulator